jgi:N4-gp56 family major capsid protein
VSLDLFIPELWGARLLEALRKELVFAQSGIINRDYQGEFSQAGDTVRLHSIGDPTIFDYTRNVDMPTAETLSAAEKTLTITQSKAFNFQVDDVDQAQTQPKVMDGAMGRAAYRLTDIADQYLAAQMLAGADPANAIGTDALPIVAPGSAPAATGAYEQLVDIGVKLNEASVPRNGRFVVVPPWYEGILNKDNRFISNAAASPAAGEPLLNGSIGRAAGFDVLVSNNVPTNAAPVGAANQSTRFRVIAGHPISTTFADTISKVEAYRPERRFADAVKGLHVYGAGVTEGLGLAVLTTTRT